MIASIIAYVLCAFSVVFTVASVRVLFEKTGVESAFAVVFTFVFGLMAWVFAYLGGLT